MIEALIRKYVILDVFLGERQTVAVDGVPGAWCLNGHASRLRWATHPGPASRSKKLVPYSRNKASRRQMSSALPSLPPRQMAKLDNMLSKITLKSHGCVSCLLDCLSGHFSHLSARSHMAWRGTRPCLGVVPGRGVRRRRSAMMRETRASLIAVD